MTDPFQAPGAAIDASASPALANDRHPAAQHNGEDRAFVVALARGLEVLACFHSGEVLLGLAEIARRCKLSRQATLRLTHTLASLGYLQYDAEVMKYRLGTATIALGNATLTQLDVRRMARPLIRELAAFVRADVALAVRERLSMICIQAVRSPAALTLGLDIGTRIPMAMTAMGRAYLAAAPYSERMELLERLREVDELQWQRIAPAIDASLSEYRETGCCVVIEEWQPGVSEIAAAFSPGDRLPMVAVGIGGSAQALAPEYLRREVRPRLLEVVRRMTYPRAGMPID
ncbi:MAG TPA: IclR family transcriptional regulator [Noviherbaspirillum sp.]